MFKKFFKLLGWFIAGLFALGLYVGDEDKTSTLVAKTNVYINVNNPKPLPLVSNTPTEPQKPQQQATKKPYVEPTPKPKTAQIPTPEPEIKPLGRKYISKKSVNIRALPSVKSLKIGNLKLNTKLNYYQFKQGWYQIKLPNSQTLGWIRGDLLADNIYKTLPKPKPQPVAKAVKKTGPRRSPYYGTCDCPYDRASNGSRCGGRSAYSRPGGRSPVCYW